MLNRSSTLVALAVVAGAACVANAQAEDENAIRQGSQNTQVIASPCLPLQFSVTTAGPNAIIETPFYSGRIGSAPHVVQRVVHSDGRTSYRFQVPLNPAWVGSVIRLSAANGRFIDGDRIVGAQALDESAIRQGSQNTQVIASPCLPIQFTVTTAGPNAIIETPFYCGRVGDAPHVLQRTAHSDGRTSYRFQVPFNPTWVGDAIRLFAANGRFIDGDRIVGAQALDESAIRQASQNTQVIASVSQPLQFTITSANPHDTIETPFYAGRIGNAPHVVQRVAHTGGSTSYRFQVPFDRSWAGDVVRLFAANGRFIDGDRIVAR